MNNYFSLADINSGETAVITDVSLTGGIKRRLQDIGIIEGTKIKCLFKSPLCDPIAYLVRGAVIAIRCEDSKSITVKLLN